eukprot:CAMPEP_0118655992 /NCGR_PEP_ID=MMETSP0785-20121206/13245_1 /TAXON_ID=91992 /ORGANISM="Bolidomonas pacifica, Strain CCMP 1866" /LENGTH=238 /DNA_ID=CAMNT_0006548809 /DNA_START=737 /DNA_END=1450 /DNA_ORIENTATION=+
MTLEEERLMGVKHELVGYVDVPDLHVGFNNTSPSSSSSPTPSDTDNDSSSNASIWVTRCLYLLRTLNPPLVVVGGTSMYNDWLINGTPGNKGWGKVMEEKDSGDGKGWGKVIEEGLKVGKDLDFEVDWEVRVGCVLNFIKTSSGKNDWGGWKEVEREIIEGCKKNDWYRVRRKIEVGVEGMVNRPDIVEREGIYKKERDSSGLEGYDFRVYFVCPKERLEHAGVVDSRCEDMIRRGLL